MKRGIRWPHVAAMLTMLAVAQGVLLYRFPDLVAGLKPSFVTGWPRIGKVQPEQRVDPVITHGGGLPDLVRSVRPAVVHIRSVVETGQRARTLSHPSGHSRGGWMPARGEAVSTVHQSLGTGTLVSVDGHVVTNAHLVQDARGLEVVMSDRRVVPATLVGMDQALNLAVLRIETEGVDLEPVYLADRLVLGQRVVAIGCPRGTSHTVMAGIVCGRGRAYGRPDLIRTDAIISPENTGGPLVDMDGRVVGINLAVTRSSGERPLLGAAIPVTLVRRMLEAVVGPRETRSGHRNGRR